MKIVGMLIVSTVLFIGEAGFRAVPLAADMGNDITKKGIQNEVHKDAINKGMTKKLETGGEPKDAKESGVAYSAMEEDVAHRYVLIVGGMYGYTYPAGSVYASDGEVVREKGSCAGLITDIGYELSRFFVVHGGFTLWYGQIGLERHLLMQELKTEYTIYTCSLNAGVIFVWKWFFLDLILFTELPLARETEEVYFAGTYVQTITLADRYEYGGFAGMGIRFSVSEILSVLVGLYGGGGFVPGIETSKNDELYPLRGVLRVGAMVHLPK
jgi:hypothetical protein